MKRRKLSSMATKNLSTVLFSTCLCLVLLFSIAGCSSERERAEVSGPSSGDFATKTTLLATIADDEKPPQPTTGHVGEPAVKNEPASFQVLFSESGRGVAYLVAREGGKVSVAHNQSKGKEYAAVGSIVLSTDGRRIAYSALVGGKWRMVVDGKEGRSFDTLLTPLFSPDGRHLAYEGRAGDKWYVVVDDTLNAGTTTSYSLPEFNADSNLIAYVETGASSAEMRLIVSDLKFGKQSVKKGIGDLLFVTSKDRTRIAATQPVDGKFRVIDFSFAKPDVVREGRPFDVVERLTISDDGGAVAYCALKQGKRVVVLDEREESLPKGLLPELPVIRPDKKGVGALLGTEGTISLHQAFCNSADAGKQYDEAANLAYSKDGRHYAYAARRGQDWCLVVDGKEGPPLDRVVTPRFSPDGKQVVYRARKDGKRFAVVADGSGKTIRQHPSYEQVFDVRFSADGRSIAYGVKDGQKLVWKVETL